MCTHGFVPQSDLYRQSKVQEVDNFSRGYYEALSSPPGLRKPGDEASPIPAFFFFSPLSMTI